MRSCTHSTAIPATKEGLVSYDDELSAFCEEVQSKESVLEEVQKVGSKFLSSAKVGTVLCVCV